MLRVLSMSRHSVSKTRVGGLGRDDAVFVDCPVRLQHRMARFLKLL
jgi:hypothetical protein